MSRAFGPRRATWITLDEPDELDLSDEVVESFRTYDLLYRTLTAVIFNFTQSGHPGGSVSAGHIMTGVLFDSLDYDLGDPVRRDADLLSFAAGHKATGLYAMWALRDEVAAIARPDLLPEDPRHRLRLEDLLGFRRNPTTSTPRFLEFDSKPLDGHPTPATPFVKIATGPSGVGMGSSLGLAFSLRDHFGEDAPKVHLLEGEGGLTPGRVYEAVASASASGLDNAICHLDWNQASIDSDRVTRDGDAPGDYVQWDPMEFFYVQDWNVLEVPDGFDMPLVLSAQRRALALDNGRPTAVVYRTEKGWGYGITGKASHGGGHGMSSDAYHELIEPVFGVGGRTLPGLGEGEVRAGPESSEEEVEESFWATLARFRELLETEYRPVCEHMADRLALAQDRLNGRNRTARADAPDPERIYAVADPHETPDELVLEPGTSIALRKQMGRALGYLNRESGGALLYGAADLLDSTAVSGAGSDFPSGFWEPRDNPGARALSVGGICEDGLACILSGVSALGFHVGVGASYGAFISPLGHIPARVHAISSQMRRHVEGADAPYRPFVLLCGHAGMKTGEDGPTHADPQAYQLHAENYVPGTAVTLTPWEPTEIWPALAAAFQARPAVIIPFVTRPGEPVLDREALGLAPAERAAQGVYRLVAAQGRRRDGTVILQGSAVTYAFVQGALPTLREEGIELDVYHVTSPELFNALSAEEQEEILPRDRVHEAMGVTDFTLPTMYRWIRSDLGLAHTLHPFRKGHYLGSGAGHHVVHEAGLDGAGQLEAVRSYVEALARARGPGVGV